MSDINVNHDLVNQEQNLNDALMNNIIVVDTYYNWSQFEFLQANYINCFKNYICLLYDRLIVFMSF